MSKLYLVTGAFGHLGSTVVRQLLERGERVRGLVLQGDTNPCPPGLIQHPLFQRVYGDVTRPDSLAAFFAHSPEDQLVVIHTAGLVSISARHKMQVYNVNVNGTANIISWCLRSHVHKLVYVSSVHAIPEPEDPAETITETQQFDPNRVVGLYAKTKAAATKRVLDAQRMGLDVTVVHPSGIIGPGDYAGSHTIQMMIDFLEGRLTACVKGGYDFVDVRDAAAGVIAAEKGRCGGCYILSGRYVPVQELLGELARISGRKPIRVVLPSWVARSVAPMAEQYYRILRQPPLFTSYSLYTLRSNGHFSHALADRELGYRVRPLEDTLLDTLTFLLQAGRLPRYKKYLAKKAGRPASAGHRA